MVKRWTTRIMALDFQTAELCEFVGPVIEVPPGT